MMKKPVTDETLEIKTWVLKVSIDCQGCQKKVQKILGGVEGVYATVVDAQHNKVTVTGAVDADKLIKRLARSGKHAELMAFPEKKLENSKKQSNNAKQSNQEETGSERKAGMGADTSGGVGKRRKKKKKEKQSSGASGNNAMTVVGSPVSTLQPLDPTNLPVINGTDPYMVGVMDPIRTIRSNAGEYEDEQAGGCFIM